MFALELDRRLRAARLDDQEHRGPPRLRGDQPAVARRRRWWTALVMRVSNRVIAQSAEMGALPTLYAATAPGLAGGTYVGPDGIGEQRGHPQRGRAQSARRATSDVARRLWEVSEELTGVRFEFV